MKNLFNKYKSFIKYDAFYVFIIINSTNVLSYLFWFLIGRFFSKDEFTFITSINSLIMILTTPAATLPHLIVKFLNNEYSANDKFNYFYNLLFIIVVSLVILFTVLIYFFDYFFLKLNYQKIHIYLVSIICVFIYVMHLITSFFQLQKNYLKYSIFTSLFIYFKFFLMIIIIYLGISGKIGFLYVNLISIFFLVIILISFFYIEFYKFKFNFFNFFNLTKFISLAKNFCILFGSSFFFIFLMNYDMIVSRSYFNTDLASEYSSLSIIGKSIFYLFSVFIFIIFPDSSLEKEFKIKKFIYIITFSLIFGSLMIFILTFFSEFIFSLTFGDKYSTSKINLCLYSYSMLFLTIANLFFFFLIGKNRYFVPMIFVSLPFIFYFFCLKYFTGKILEFVFVQFVSNLILLILIASFFIYIKKYKNEN